MERTKIHIPIKRSIALRAVYAFIIVCSFLAWILGFKMGLLPAIGGVIIINLAFFIAMKSKIPAFKRTYYVSLDEEGISWSVNIITHPVSLYWSEINQINEQLYEVNFRHKKTGQNFNLQTNYIPEDQLEAFWEVLSNNRKKFNL